MIAETTNLPSIYAGAYAASLANTSKNGAAVDSALVRKDSTQSTDLAGFGSQRRSTGANSYITIDLTASQNHRSANRTQAVQETRRSEQQTAADRARLATYNRNASLGAGESLPRGLLIDIVA